MFCKQISINFTKDLYFFKSQHKYECTRAPKSRIRTGVQSGQGDQKAPIPRKRSATPEGREPTAAGSGTGCCTATQEVYRVVF